MLIKMGTIIIIDRNLQVQYTIIISTHYLNKTNCPRNSALTQYTYNGTISMTLVCTRTVIILKESKLILDHVKCCDVK